VSMSGGRQEDVDNRRPAYEVVRERLRTMILSGDYPVGSRLVQSDIAHALNVSTTPVREALRDLATEGLIRLDAHRGAVVSRLTREEVAEVYRIRRLLECDAIRRATELITDDQVEEARAIQLAADAEDDPVVWTDLNRRFHEVFLNASDLPRIASIVRTLNEASSAYVATSMLLGRQYPSHTPHWDLLDALEKRDGDAAVQILETHIDQTLAVVLAGIPATRSAIGTRG
jgi:DNA-binding GntR family transcriptional regulator